MTNFRQYTNTAFDFFRNILDMVFPSKIAVNIDPKIPDALYLLQFLPIDMQNYFVVHSFLSWMKDDEICLIDGILGRCFLGLDSDSPSLVQ